MSGNSGFGGLGNSNGFGSPFGSSSTSSTTSYNPFSSSSSTTAYDACTLTPRNRFFSAVLTAFVGSIITGITGGYIIAFYTAWICWFATTRIIVVGIWQSVLALCFRPIKGGDQFIAIFAAIPPFNKLPAFRRGKLTDHPLFRAMNDPQEDEKHNGEHPLQASHIRNTSYSSQYTALLPHIDTAPAAAPPRLLPTTPSNSARLSTLGRIFGFKSDPPTVMGWIGWVYATLYTPIVQILWLASNWNYDGPSAGVLKLVRAIGISVAALSLTIDTKARFGALLERKMGKWVRIIFSFIQAGSTLMLGIIAIILIGKGISQMDNVPVFIIPVMVVFSIVWMLGSFLMLPPFDGGNSPKTFWAFLAGLFMGIFGGAFTAAPAFAAMTMADGGGPSLGDNLGCQSEA